MREIKSATKSISVDIEKLKKIVIGEWQSGKLYKFYYEKGDRGVNLYRSILAGIAEYAEDLGDEITENSNLDLDECLDKAIYPKSDIRSIGLEVLRILDCSWSIPESLTTDDIPAILEFLETPPNKSLEAWNKWKKYWANLDYPKRRKKLLENK